MSVVRGFLLKGLITNGFRYYNQKKIRGIQTLQDVVILGIYLRRNDRFHDIRSDLVHNSFTQLETFYDKDFSGLYVYFDAHPSNWAMELFLEWIVIPKEINISENVPSKPESNE